MLSHFLFNIVKEQMIFPFLIAVLFSIAYSFYGTAIYVVPSFIVQEHQLTTAYGIYNTLYCLIFTGISVGCGTIVDYAGYMWAEIYFFLLIYATLHSHDIDNTSHSTLIKVHFYVYLFISHNSLVLN